MAAGFKAFEMSVGVSSDGQWLLAHDYGPSSLVPGKTGGWDTYEWDEIATWEIGKRSESHPYEGEPQHFLRLVDAIDLLPQDAVLFIDHKWTSNGEGSATGQADRDRLLDYLETVPGATGRIIWKTFVDGHVSAAKAKERGFSNWGIFYDDEPVHDASLYDALGMNYNAEQEHWDTIKAYGLPVVAHVVRSVAARDMAAGKGADGYMVERPSLFQQ